MMGQTFLKRALRALRDEGEEQLRHEHRRRPAVGGAFLRSRLARCATSAAAAAGIDVARATIRDRCPRQLLADRTPGRILRNGRRPAAISSGLDSAREELLPTHE